MKRYVLSMLGVCFVIMQIVAQSSYFTCDFEDESQNAQWSLVNGPKAATIANKWCIGSATSHGGQNAMYVSVDTGKTVSYYNISAYVVSYIDVTLKAGTYDLSFDWRAMGNIASTSWDALYVCWVPMTNAFGDTILLNSNNSNVLSNDLQQYAVEVNESNDVHKLIGSATWKNCTASVRSFGDTYRLAFVWLTCGLDVVNPGACIDNIMLVDVNTCETPTEFHVSSDGKLTNLSWAGKASAYEVRCYSYMDSTWRNQIVYDTTAYTFTGLPEGLCDFYVSSICDDGVKSVPAVVSEHFIYYPDNHCIDYLTLDSTNCFVSNEKVGSSRDVHALTWKNQLVNDGYASIASRHTIHYSRSETDPRTCGGLRTVPEGELASVRLGNWDTGQEAERVEFKFHVDAKVNPVLLLKYAVVLQKPNDGCTPNPGFLLRVLNEKGRLVSSCASADFDFRKAADAEWEMCDRDHSTGNLTEVRWKDWTTVGVNLAEFDGQDLTIQLTTYDCGAGGHYGYSYFTLGCSDGQLSGMSCGVENTKFIAPSGFVYQWYLQNDPDSILGHEQEFEVLPTDTNHYMVDMMFAQDSSCYFSLVASAQPYQPVAAARTDYQSVDCQNIVQFTNLSHVIEINQLTNVVTHTNKPVEWVMWDFGDGTVSYEENPKHVFDNQGGPINVKLIAHLATCVDTLYIVDTIPAIGTTRDTLMVNICAGSSYVYSYVDKNNVRQDSALVETGTYDFTTISILTGCDSIVTINLNVQDTLWTHIDTLIMRGESIEIADKVFSQTGTYEIPLQSQDGCDSIVVLDLIVYDKLKVNAVNEYTVCHGETSFLFEYTIEQGYTKLYSLRFEDDVFASLQDTLEFSNTIEVAIPEDAIPNTYVGELSFVDTISDDVRIPFQLHILYNADLVAQRWNDVLAVKNAEYNGGFEFAKYQWYKKGATDTTFLPLLGDTLSYLYEPLDVEAVYAVGLTRQGDTTEILTCDVYPEDFSSVPAVPTLVEKSQPISIAARGQVAAIRVAQWTMFNGTIVATQQVVDGVGLVAPHVSGLYLLTLTDDSGKQLVETILVR